jgi:hypothetical protein
MEFWVLHDLARRRRHADEGRIRSWRVGDGELRDSGDIDRTCTNENTVSLKYTWHEVIIRCVEGL